MSKCKKTNYLIFSNRKKISVHPDLIMANLKSEEVQSTKFLGVEIEDKLNWWSHTRSVERKLSSAIFIIRSLRYKINRTTSLKLYDTLFLPLFTLL